MRLLLVEAASTGFSDLGTAVDAAVSMGAVAVSNSYGGPEWPSETDDDTYYNHPGVAITVATGDCGYDCAPSSDNIAGTVQNIEYPAASQYVVAVGGTTLTRNSNARGWTESAWGHNGYGAGSGCSLYEPKPSWQKDTGCSMRTRPTSRPWPTPRPASPPTTATLTCHRHRRAGVSWAVRAQRRRSSPPRMPWPAV